MSPSLPQPMPSPQPEAWARFSADPRAAGYTRASDADRSTAVQVLNEAYAEGRLDEAERAERVDRALATKQLGELVPLLVDVVPERATSRPSAPAAAVTPARPRIGSKAISAWLGLALLFNVIWLLTWLPSGHPYYYWPMWPMLGTAIPVFLASMRLDGMSGRDRSERQARRDERRGTDQGQWPRDDGGRELR